MCHFCYLLSWNLDWSICQPQKKIIGLLLCFLWKDYDPVFQRKIPLCSGVTIEGVALEQILPPNTNYAVLYVSFSSLYYIILIWYQFIKCQWWQFRIQSSCRGGWQFGVYINISWESIFFSLHRDASDSESHAHWRGKLLVPQYTTRAETQKMLPSRCVSLQPAVYSENRFIFCLSQPTAADW